MNKLLCCLAISLFMGYAPTGFSQTILSSADPAKNIDLARLARIDTLVNGYIGRGWLNGAVTLVVQDNAVVQYKAYGYSDREARKLMVKDDLFRLASQTKAIVSAAILLLYEEGKFLLDEPISDFIPSFRNPRVLDTFNASDSSYTTVPAKREISFRDLLTHTSGLDYPGIGSEKMRAIYAKAHIPGGLGVIDVELQERMAALGKLPLVHQPGEKWTYGLSVDVLGSLVEILSGKSLEAFLTERIFQPLGMNDTYFNVPTSKASRLVAVYTEDSLHRVIRLTKVPGIDLDYPLQKKRYFSGGAGLTGTAYDYAIFLQMLLNGGKYKGVQILSPRTVQMMTSGQLGFNYNELDNFGLGFAITSERSAARGPRNAGSFAWGGYFGTTYWADPKAKMLCLIMTQQVPNSHGELSGKVEELIYQSLK